MTDLSEDGIYDGLPAEEYHASDPISRSKLVEYLQCPARAYKRFFDPRRPPASTWQSQREDNLGSLVHTLILEPSAFHQRYCTFPKINRNTNVWKDQVAQAEAAGKIALQQDQEDAARTLADAVRSNRSLRTVLRRGAPEVSVYVTDPATGLRLRCRIDWLHERDDGAVVILDLKSCGDADAEAFARHAAKHRYHVQAAFYWHVARLAGLDVEAFVFGAIETRWPHESALLAFDQDSMDHAFKQVRGGLAALAASLEHDTWAGYTDDGIGVMRLPNYLTEEPVNGI